MANKNININYEDVLVTAPKTVSYTDAEGMTVEGSYEHLTGQWTLVASVVVANGVEFVARVSQTFIIEHASDVDETHTGQDTLSTLEAWRDDVLADTFTLVNAEE